MRNYEPAHTQQRYATLYDLVDIDRMQTVSVFRIHKVFVVTQQMSSTEKNHKS